MKIHLFLLPLPWAGNKDCLHPEKVMFAFLVNTTLCFFLSTQYAQVSHIWLTCQKIVKLWGNGVPQMLLPKNNLATTDNNFPAQWPNILLQGMYCQSRLLQMASSATSFLPCKNFSLLSSPVSTTTWNHSRISTLLQFPHRAKTYLSQIKIQCCLIFIFQRNNFQIRYL